MEKEQHGKEKMARRIGRERERERVLKREGITLTRERRKKGLEV